MTTNRLLCISVLVTGFALMSQSGRGDPRKDECGNKCYAEKYFTDGTPDCWAYDPADCNWCKNLGRCDPEGIWPEDCVKVKDKDGKFLQTKRGFYQNAACSPLCIPEKNKYSQATKPGGMPDSTETLDLHQCDLDATIPGPTRVRR